MHKTLVGLILAATVVRGQPASPVLSLADAEALVAKVAQDPEDRGAQTRLARNYVYFILGVTALEHDVIVAGYDTAKAQSEFAIEARKALEKTRLPVLAGEAGNALWQLSSSLQAYRWRQGDHAPPSLLDDPDKILAAKLIDRAIELEPGIQKWRTYRSYVLQLRAAVMKPDVDESAKLYQTIKADLGAVTGANRSGLLLTAAQQAVRVGQLDDAKSYAQEALAEAATKAKGWNTGNEIFSGNTVLGQVALRKGDKKAAAEYLLAAGATPGSPQLNSFGPSMVLAKELLDAGAGREQVIAFFDECRKFWKMDRGMLDQWTEMVKKGVTPDFGVSVR